MSPGIQSSINNTVPVYSDGVTNDFRATRKLGLAGSYVFCAQIGVGYNQTLWGTRYFSAV